MKILHIISSGGMYGAEAVIMNLSRALNDGPHRSLLGVFSNSSNPNLQLHQSSVKEGIESHLIPCRQQLDWRAISFIRELANGIDVDVVHAHGYKADVYVYLALRTSGIPFVSTCHNWLDSDWKDLFYGIIDRLILRKYARVVAVSEEVRDRLIRSGVKARKIEVIRNGIDPRRFDSTLTVLKHDLDEGANQMVGFVGRLSAEKGVDIFLHAAALVLSQLTNAKFVLVGDGPDLDKLDELIEKLSIRGSVHMLGRRNDMPLVYASLDVMVSASRQEGLPIAILEGMACGLPLVATNVGDVPTVIQDGCTGLLVPPENPKVMAEAIIELLQSPAKRRRLGSAARRLIEERFSAARMATDYVRVYERAVAAES